MRYRLAMPSEQDLQFAVDLARDAGRIVREQYGRVERLTKTHATTKDEAVTEADRASQRLIVQRLRQRYPGDGIVGEESDSGTGITIETPEPMGRNWVIDPIDGTNNFIAGLGNFAVCIALLDGGMPTLGVVYDVTRDAAYAAGRGLGAWMGNRRLRALETPMSARSLVMLTSSLVGEDGRLPGWVGAWLERSTWKIRMLGSAALEATQVAAGVAHAAITVQGRLWDCCAPAALVLEAGGRLTDLAGAEVFPFDLRRYQGAKVPFIAAAPSAHAALLADLKARP